MQYRSRDPFGYACTSCMEHEPALSFHQPDSLPLAGNRLEVELDVTLEPSKMIK